MKEVLCVGGCRRWFDASFHWCPYCEWERPRFNGHMYRAALDNSLYRSAEHAEHERKLEAGLRAGYEIPPSKEMKKKAKQIVKDM